MPERDSCRRRADFSKPERCGSLPYWVVPDSKRILKGVLHVCRRFEFSRDVIVLISEATSDEYVKYLEERNYVFHEVGTKSVDLGRSLELLSSRYGFKKVLSDTGRVLGNLLVERALASELSLLVHPVTVGEKSYNIFGTINSNPKLILCKQKAFPGGFVWLVYKFSRRTAG